jgi:hypothetical protein
MTSGIVLHRRIEDALLTVVRIIAVVTILAGCAASSTGSLEPGTVQVRVNGDIHNGVAAGTSSIK